MSLADLIATLESAYKRGETLLKGIETREEEQKKQKEEVRQKRLQRRENLLQRLDGVNELLQKLVEKNELTFDEEEVYKKTVALKKSILKEIEGLG